MESRQLGQLVERLAGRRILFGQPQTEARSTPHRRPLSGAEAAHQITPQAEGLRARHRDVDGELGSERRLERGRGVEVPAHQLGGVEIHQIGPLGAADLHDELDTIALGFTGHGSRKRYPSAASEGSGFAFTPALDLFSTREYHRSAPMTLGEIGKRPPGTLAERFWSIAKSEGPPGDDSDADPKAVVRHVLSVLDKLSAGEVGDNLSQSTVSFLALLRQEEAAGNLSYASPEQARGRPSMSARWSSRWAS